MNVQPTPATIPPGLFRTGRDDSTRYLCAAAHLDANYANAAIKEFVVEPTRPIPPSPGFRPANVLAEAIAARARRKLRDGLLALLMIAFVAMAWSWWLLYAWIGIALVAAVPSAVRKLPGKRLQRSKMAIAYTVLGIFGLLIFALLTGYLEDLLDSSSSRGSSYYGRDYDYYDGYAGSSSDVVTDLSIIPLILMLAVLMADRLAVWNLLTGRFGYGARHLPLGEPFGGERPLLAISPPSFRRHLERYRTGATHPRDSAPLIVHRGYDPFVGAGLRRESWSMALPLEKLTKESKPDGSPFDELSTALLYERVRAAMAVLQESTALSPDRRLRNLRIVDAVYVSSDELIDHLNEPVSVTYLSDPDSPPHAYLPPGEVAALRGEPREWSRYYLCFEVETWNRDLVMSGFLHAAVDASTLYLEWTPCVLPPIQDRYREVDELSPGIGRPVWQAVVRWLKLPVTIFGRTAGALALIRPLPRQPGSIKPDAYGNLHTLREMAAAENVSSYFQLVDIERYEKIMHSRLLPAISQVLRDCGYSQAQFERQAEQITNNTFVGDIYGNVNTGTVRGDMSTVNAVTTGEPEK